MNIPDPKTLVAATGLPSASPLQRVLVFAAERLAAERLGAERLGAERLGTLHARPPMPAHVPLKQGGAFEGALRRDRSAKGGAVIAEYKQASPSLGPFAAGTPLLERLQAYADGGAAAFSILTEPALFLGSADDLARGARLGPPCLYKGFVLAEAQLDEAAACGAAAVLLIARVLKEHTADFAEAARARGLEPLVELHDLTEIPFAQAAGAQLVGINARDLSTFTLGAPGAEPLRQAFPDAVLIRESGLATPASAVAAFQEGFDAVLIGEALMRSADPKGFLDRVFAAAAEEASR